MMEFIKTILQFFLKVIVSTIWVLRSILDWIERHNVYHLLTLIAIGIMLYTIHDARLGTIETVKILKKEVTRQISEYRKSANNVIEQTKKIENERIRVALKKLSTEIKINFEIIQLFKKYEDGYCKDQLMIDKFKTTAYFQGLIIKSVKTEKLAGKIFFLYHKFEYLNSIIQSSLLVNITALTSRKKIIRKNNKMVIDIAKSIEEKCNEVIEELRILNNIRSIEHAGCKILPDGRVMKIKKNKP
ncbi:hypothetical protein KAJ27_17275 [bacterium]|nr:hypothetical protein [Bacteroidales bacterium]MCK5685887.1 hypothetical protein [bacterium]